MEAAPGLMQRDAEMLTQTQLGREEVDRALQEADQEGGREEHCREKARDSAVDACCLSHRTPLSSRMTTCDLHCFSPE